MQLIQRRTGHAHSRTILSVYGLGNANVDNTNDKRACAPDQQPVDARQGGPERGRQRAARAQQARNGGLVQIVRVPQQVQRLLLRRRRRSASGSAKTARCCSLSVHRRML